jgi:hypothetical protein
MDFAIIWQALPLKTDIPKYGDEKNEAMGKIDHQMAAVGGF